MRSSLVWRLKKIVLRTTEIKLKTYFKYNVYYCNFIPENKIKSSKVPHLLGSIFFCLRRTFKLIKLTRHKRIYAENDWNTIISF